MTASRLSESEIKCKLLWKLCRRHAWKKTGVERADLVSAALQDTEQGRGKQLVDELRDEPYIDLTDGTRYSVKNNPLAHAQAAFRLRETCGYTKIQIETTLSRFEQAGGFDAFDRDDVLAELTEW